jgi:hypothetical protein
MIAREGLFVSRNSHPDPPVRAIHCYHQTLAAKNFSCVQPCLVSAFVIEQRCRQGGSIGEAPSPLSSGLCRRFCFPGSRFNETYGSLGAVIGFMIWMWLSDVVLLIGAELNAEMEDQTLVDTTTSDPQRIGRYCWAFGQLT